VTQYNDPFATGGSDPFAASSGAYSAGYGQPGVPAATKSKLAAGLLGIFLGGLGIHNFYLGYKGKALAQLLIAVLTIGFGLIVTSIWGLVEGIMILAGAIDKDASGAPLVG
jgi:TM2 domain-containing membrane protein YozV